MQPDVIPEKKILSLPPNPFDSMKTEIEQRMIRGRSLRHSSSSEWRVLLSMDVFDSHLSGKELHQYIVVIVTKLGHYAPEMRGVERMDFRCVRSESVGLERREETGEYKLVIGKYVLTARSCDHDPNEVARDLLDGRERRSIDIPEYGTVVLQRAEELGILLVLKERSLVFRLDLNGSCKVFRVPAEFLDDENLETKLGGALELNAAEHENLLSEVNKRLIAKAL